jgi:hypothetical protein
MGKASGGGSTNKSWDTTVERPDAQTEAWTKQAFENAQQAGNAGPSPLVGGATGYNTSMMNAGGQANAALMGDTNAANKMMNPYMDQVIGGMNKQWDRNGLLAVNGW